MNTPGQLHDMNLQGHDESRMLAFLGAGGRAPMLSPSQLLAAQAQQQQSGALPLGLNYTTDTDARRAISALLMQNNGAADGPLPLPPIASSKKDLLMKRACGAAGDEANGPSAKKQRISDSGNGKDDASAPDAETSPPTNKKAVNYDPNVKIPESKEGLSFYEENDVLCGRGGGTNVHPGNKLFRDLINSHRREYLRAKKNDKPDISRSIVRHIRERGGRFLKRDEKAGLWFEIGDDGAREKTSQALRQRAPEMRRLLFRDEYNQEEIDYGTGMMPVVYHPNPAENAYLRSLSDGLFAGQMKEQQLQLAQEREMRAQMAQQMAVPAPMPSSLGAYKNDLLLKTSASGMNPYLDPQAMMLQQGAQQWRTEALIGRGMNRFTPHGA